MHASMSTCRTMFFFLFPLKLLGFFLHSLQVLQVFNAVVLSTFGLANATTMAPNLSKAMAAAESIFSTVDRLSSIDPMDDKGEVPNVQGQGALELRDVHFSYPLRPDVRVLRGLSLSVAAGSTVAVVGESGSGKSTVISLIERFYDPLHGQVTMRSMFVCCGCMYHIGCRAWSAVA